MKKNNYMYLCACLLLCGTAASAESLGASGQDIQNNFNRLVTTKQCPRCDLRGAVLTRMNLQGADLQGADLSDAKLSLTNLSKANLHNAVLRGAVLGGTDFAGADLRGADLTDAQLAGAYLKEALMDQEITPEKPYKPEELPEVLPKEGTGTLPEPPQEVERSEEEVVLPDPTTQAPPQELISPARGIEAASETAASDSAEKESMPSADISVVEEPPVEPELPAPSGLSEADQGLEEKKKVALPDIAGRAATTLRSKELVPIEDAQIAPPAQKEVQLDSALAKKQTKKQPTGLDEIPVINTASGQKEGGAEDGGAELSLWDTFTSLFGSETAEKKKAAEAVTEAGEVEGVAQEKKEVRPTAQAQLAEQGAELEKEVPAIAAQALPQAVSKGQRAGTEPQLGSYTVETFAQSRVRLQGLIDKLHEERRCVACDLAGAELRGEDLEEVDLERADLSGARLEGTDLRSANLKGVNFTSANLHNADLRAADLYLADFTHANLTGAQLQGALLDSTNFTGAIGAQLDFAHEKE